MQGACHTPARRIRPPFGGLAGPPDARETRRACTLRFGRHGPADELFVSPCGTIPATRMAPVDADDLDVGVPEMWRPSHSLRSKP
jgi:hypothetical protein